MIDLVHPEDEAEVERRLMTGGSRRGPVRFSARFRHAHGDWGDLDTDDVAENEYSLVYGLWLLSAYALRDGTRIWIIGAGDVSVCARGANPARTCSSTRRLPTRNSP